MDKDKERFDKIMALMAFIAVLLLSGFAENVCQKGF